MSSYRSFEVQEVGPVLLIKPAESDIVERELINILSDELVSFLEERRPEKVVFTLKHAIRFSSEAIGGLIRMERQLAANGGKMKLCMDNEIRKLFQVTSLDGGVFEIYETESEAVAAFFEHGGDIFE